MPRPRKTDTHLPPCVYPRHGAFWHIKSGKWTRLGATLEDELVAYARMHDAPRGGMPDLIDTVLTHIRPNLSKATISQYDTAARKLKKMLVQFAPDQVRPKHVAAIKVALASTPNMAKTGHTVQGVHAGGAKLVVPWTTELRAVVDRAKLLHGNIKALTLLHNRRGKTPDYRTVALQWTKACGAAGVADAHIHDLRAVALTAARKQGLNATRLAGHSSPAQTERYLRDREEPLASGPSFGQSNRQGE
jgi:hypothetical protein